MDICFTADNVDFPPAKRRTFGDVAAGAAFARFYLNFLCSIAAYASVTAPSTKRETV